MAMALLALFTKLFCKETFITVPYVVPLAAVPDVTPSEV